MKRDGEENETTYNQESKVLLVQTIAVHFEVGGVELKNKNAHPNPPNKMRERWGKGVGWGKKTQNDEARLGVL